MNKLLAINLFLYSSIGTGIANDSETKFSDKSKSVKPNFIIIMADDMGYGDIGCYGNRYIKTPNLDRMADEGIRFTDFHSNGACCSPTRAALLTGRYQQRTGVTLVITAKDHRDAGLPLAEVTIAEVLKKEGYTTGIFGKWHLGYPKKFNPVYQGFDEFIGFVSGNIDYHSKVDMEGYYDWWDGAELTNQRGYSTDLIHENSMDFIKRNKESPFLLYIAHEAPHGPYQNRESKADRYPGGILGVDHPGANVEKNIPPIYKDMIEILDETIGETLNILKELNLDNKTIVIFCSDNGANNNGSNGVLSGFKASVWEGGHRVPAIIRWPDYIKPGLTSQETILTMDIFPTILELAGVENYRNIDGKSFAGHLLYNKPLTPRTLFWQHADKYAARKGNWKLIIPGNNASPELYNLNLDLREMNNVADKYPKILNELLLELKEWKKDVTTGVEIISLL
jgi:arylsulfatase A